MDQAIWQHGSGGCCFLLLELMVVSCRKGEGTGGTGSISGTLIEHYYNDDYSRLIYQNPAIDEEVLHPVW